MSPGAVDFYGGFEPEELQQYYELAVGFSVQAIQGVSRFTSGRQT